MDPVRRRALQERFERATGVLLINCTVDPAKEKPGPHAIFRTGHLSVGYLLYADQRIGLSVRVNRRLFGVGYLDFQAVNTPGPYRPRSIPQRIADRYHEAKASVQ